MGNTYGCAEQYLCATAPYLLSILAHAYNTIIDCGVGAPVHGRYVNATNKRFLSVLIADVQLSGVEAYESHMAMHTSTANTNISLARELQKHLSDPTWAHGLLDRGKYRKCASKLKWTDW